MYLLFIMSVRSFALSFALRAIVSFEERINIIQIVQSHFARAGQRTLFESNICHLVLLHYSGGWPVPRAVSLSSGGKQIYTNILAYVGRL